MDRRQCQSNQDKRRPVFWKNKERADDKVIRRSK